ncbi:MAG: prephenate dehydratase [Candidatus Competibacterales bacterium]
MAHSSHRTIAFQGFPGAYSELASREAFAEHATLPCTTFEDVFAAVEGGAASLGMIPIDNSVAGRVADIHHLLPQSTLHIIGEHFLPINHQLLALPGVALTELKAISSHVHALNQCRRLIGELNLAVRVHADTAGAAKTLAESGDRTLGAIASTLAAEIYGLQVLRSNIEDASHNTTRFVIVAREPKTPAVGPRPPNSSFMFGVRNNPAALYKALGGIAPNGVNITKLESYIGHHFAAAQFYADIEGHPQERPVALALEELHFFAKEVRLLGTYPASPLRQRWRAGAPL